MRYVSNAARIAVVISSVSLAGVLVASRAGWMPVYGAVFLDRAPSHTPPTPVAAANATLDDADNYEIPGGKFGPIKVDDNTIGLASGLCTGLPPVTVYPAAAKRKAPEVKPEVTIPAGGVPKFDLGAALGSQRDEPATSIFAAQENR